MSHNKENSLCARPHWNLGLAPSNSYTFETRKTVQNFIVQYSDNHRVFLSSRIPGYQDQHLVLLSSAETKKNVHKFYNKSCIADDIVSVYLSIFLQLWQNLIPWVVITKPATEPVLDLPTKQQPHFPVDQLHEGWATESPTCTHREFQKKRIYYKDQCMVAKEHLDERFPAFSIKYGPVNLASCSFEGVTHISWTMHNRYTTQKTNSSLAPCTSKQHENVGFLVFATTVATCK